MTTQVIFKIDKKLKEKAMKKAQSQGLPFASVLKFATRAYVEGEFNIGIKEEKFRPAVRQEIAEALEDIKQGKNLSPAFDNVEDAINYLKNL